jgi:hypothetical protein
MLLGGSDDASLIREYASVAEASAAIQCSDAQLKEAFDAGSEVRCVDGDDWYRILNLFDGDPSDTVGGPPTNPLPTYGAIHRK